MTRRVVVFDLDGTLVNSTLQIYTAMAMARRSMCMPEITPDFIAQNLGLPINDLIPEKELDETLRQELIRIFRAELLELIHQKNTLYPGALALINELINRGFSIGIATSKPQALAEAVVLHSELKGKIDCVQGTDSFPPKPSPEVIMRCLAKLEYKTGVMLGDRIEDVTAAKLARVPSIGISHTAHTKSELLLAGASYALDNFTDLKFLIQIISELSITNP